MANNIDPLKNFLFRVTRTKLGESQIGLEADDQAGFRTISGLSRKIDVITYREGGDPRYSRKLSGLVTYDPITMEQGIFRDQSDLWKLTNEVYSAQGAGITGTINEEDAVKEDITIKLLEAGQGGDPIVSKAWKCFDTWVSEWNLGNFDANTSDVLGVSCVVQMRYFEEVNVDSGMPIALV